MDFKVGDYVEFIWKQDKHKPIITLLCGFFKPNTDEMLYSLILLDNKAEYSSRGWRFSQTYKKIEDIFKSIDSKFSYKKVNYCFQEKENGK